jgi:hypothetical protein
MPEPTRRARIVAGAVCLAAGAWVIHGVGADPSRLRAPAAIGYVASGVFVAAAVSLWLQALGRVRAALVSVLLLLTGMASIGGWIGFGPGRRECQAGDEMVAVMAGEGVCRAVFGSAAVFTAAIALVLLRSLVRDGRQSVT